MCATVRSPVGSSSVPAAIDVRAPPARRQNRPRAALAAEAQLALVGAIPGEAAVLDEREVLRRHVRVGGDVAVRHAGSGGSDSR